MSNERLDFDRRLVRDSGLFRAARPSPAAVIPSSRDAQTPQLAARWRHKSIFPSVARSVGRTDSLSDGPRSRCGTKLPRSLLTLRQYSSTAAPVSVPRAAILSIRLSLSLSLSLSVCLCVCACVCVVPRPQSLCYMHCDRLIGQTGAKPS